MCDRCVPVVVAADGSAVEVAPAYCSNGHQLRPGWVVVGYRPCGCLHTGHRSYRCRACNVTDFYPPCAERPAAQPPARWTRRRNDHQG